MTMFRKILAIAALLACGTANAATTMYVAEFTSSPPTYVSYQAAKVPPLAEVNVAFGSQSAVFQATTGLVRIHCDEACQIEFGTAPVINSGSMRLAAGQTEYFVVPAGAGFRVRVAASP